MLTTPQPQPSAPASEEQRGQPPHTPPPRPEMLQQAVVVPIPAMDAKGRITRHLLTPLCSQPRSAKMGSMLVPCKECGREVSEEVSACPHCGVLSPGATQIMRKNRDGNEQAGEQAVRRPRSRLVMVMVGSLLLVAIAGGGLSLWLLGKYRESEAALRASRAKLSSTEEKLKSAETTLDEFQREQNASAERRIAERLQIADSACEFHVKPVESYATARCMIRNPRDRMAAAHVVAVLKRYQRSIVERGKDVVVPAHGSVEVRIDFPEADDDDVDRRCGCSQVTSPD